MYSINSNCNRFLQQQIKWCKILELLQTLLQQDGSQLSLCLIQNLQQQDKTCFSFCLIYILFLLSLIFSLITLPLFLPSLSICFVLLLSLSLSLSQVVQWWFDHKWVLVLGFWVVGCWWLMGITVVMAWVGIFLEITIKSKLFCQSIYISGCKFSFNFAQKNLHFLFYTLIFTKHPHQFVYFTPSFI